MSEMRPNWPYQETLQSDQVPCMQGMDRRAWWTLLSSLCTETTQSTHIPNGTLRFHGTTGQEWIQVTNKKKRKQQGHPAGPASTPTSPQCPQTSPKPAKKSKVTDKSQPKKSKTFPSHRADNAGVGWFPTPFPPPPPPPPSPTPPTVPDHKEFLVRIPKSPTATRAKTPYVQQIKAAPTVTPLNLATILQVKVPQAPPAGVKGNLAGLPAAPVKKAPGVKQSSSTGSGKAGGLVVKKTALTHASRQAKANPKTKLRSAAHTPLKRMAHSSHSWSSAASTRPPNPKVFRH